MTVLITLLLACVASVPSQADDREPNYVYYIAEHLDAVRAEREAELLDMLAEADEQSRAAVSQMLIGSRRRGQPAMKRSELDVLARARRLLLDGEEREWELQQLADCLSLRVTPGCFAAREEGRGEYTVVHVQKLWQVESLDAYASLYWIDPKGKRQRVVTEPVSSASFDAGFEMFIRPPAASAGRFHLEIELEQGIRIARGVPVPVDCVAELAELKGRLRGTSPLGAGSAGRAFAQRLELLERIGLRTTSPVPLAEQRAILAGESSAELRVVELAEAPSAVLYQFESIKDPVHDQAVLLASRPGQPALDLSAGRTGKAWRERLAAKGVRVFVASLPATEHGVEPWLALAEQLKQQESIQELTLVAGGELALQLPRALLRADEHPVNALVLFDSPAVNSPQPEQVPCPTLLVAGAAAEAGEEHGADRWTRIRRTEANLVLEPELPRLVAEWLAHE